VDGLLAAVATGDVQGVLDRMAPDVVCTSDGGPHRRAARRPVVSAARVARLLVNLGRRYDGRIVATPASVNGDAGCVIEVDGRVDQVLSCSVADGRVVAIRIMRNPDKLRRVGTPVLLR
jgi:RNA polymerase sigma-70 factor (ECF subfamily)